MTPDAADGLGLEIRRKLIHFLALIIPFGLYFFPLKPALILLFIVTAGALLVETLRFRLPKLQRLFVGLLSPVLRKHEERALTGSTALLLSASILTLVLLLFQGDLFLSLNARLSLFYAFSFLILGDAAAAVFGKRFGRRKLFGEKTLAGSLACLAACLAVYLLTAPILDGSAPFRPVLIAACLTTLLEALPLKFNDNLFVPPVSGVMLYWMLES